MSLCLSCARRNDQDPCMGQFSDGHYYWGTPVVRSELEKVPSWVRDKEVYSVKECSR
jgi:hypothetical protein